MTDEIPIAPAEPIYEALQAFFRKISSADGLQNPDERTIALADAAIALTQQMEENGGALIWLGER